MMEGGADGGGGIAHWSDVFIVIVHICYQLTAAGQTEAGEDGRLPLTDRRSLTAVAAPPQD